MDINPALSRKRARHYEHASAHLLPELVNRLAWPRQNIERQQLAALRALLHHASQHSPWHRERLRGIDPNSATLADLARVPPMTKRDLMENWDRIVTVEEATLAGARAALQGMADQQYMWEDTVLVTSGGTTGQPGVFLYDWNGLGTYWSALCRSIVPTLMRRVSNPREVRKAAIGAGMSGHISYVIGRIFSDPQKPGLQLSSWNSTAELIEPLNQCDPQLLSCYPSLIPTLAAAARAGQLRIAPDIIFFGSEHLTDSNRQLAQATWPRADLFDCWGTGEGGLAFPCPYGNNFHLSEDLCVVEPVDEHGAPVGPGQPSDGIYLTNLFNRALPIIRYHIDDIFELNPHTCACGSAFQSVDRVRGRTAEKFSYGQLVVHPHAIELGLVEQAAIVEYQIHQTRAGVRIMLRTEGEVDFARAEERVRLALRGFGLEQPEVELAVVDAIDRTAAGKLRRFIPLEA